MPQRKQPRSLQTICQECITSHLAVTCRKLQSAAQDGAAAQVLSASRRLLRPVYLSKLSGSMRCELLKEASRLLSSPPPDGSSSPGAGPAPLYLLTLLLAPDVRALRIELCCYYGCSHQAALLKLLAQEGCGLRTLEIARTALLRLDKGLLRSALTAAPNLRKLVMRNIANDAILQVIGSSCPSLEVLDVAHSRQVSDNGVRDLLVSVELRDKSLNGAKDEPKENKQRWNKLRTLARLVPWLRADAADKQRKVLLQYCERRNALCASLHTFDISNTGVSSGGVLLALTHAPRLQSFGDYAHTGTALEALQKTPPTTDDAHNKFHLIAARTARITQHRLEVMTQYCPELRALVLDEPRLPATALQCLPKGLCILAVLAAPSDPGWLQCLYSYLRTSGASLMELTLRFTLAASAAAAPHDEPRPSTNFDLTRVVECCPQLRNLVVDGVAVGWDASWAEKKALPHLKVAQLGRSVSSAAVGKLMKSAPELRVMHVYSSPDLQDRELRHLVPHMKKLECLYVYEARQVKTAGAVGAVLGACGQLSRLGSLSNWGLDCDAARLIHHQIAAGQLQLELLTGAHWFNSSCVRIA